MTDERKTIGVSPREAKAVLEALRALRKNMPGGLDFDEVGALCERLDRPRPTITVVQRGPCNFTAHLNGDESIRDCGQTPVEAVGRIVMFRPDELGIEIETDGGR